MDFGDGLVSEFESDPLRTERPAGLPTDVATADSAPHQTPLPQPAVDIRPAKRAVRRQRFRALIVSVLFLFSCIAAVLVLLATVPWVYVLQPLGLTEQVAAKVLDVQPDHPAENGAPMWALTVEWTTNNVSHQETRSAPWKPERGTYYSVAEWHDHVSLTEPNWGFSSLGAGSRLS